MNWTLFIVNNGTKTYTFYVVAEVTWRMKRKYDGKNVELVNEGELSMYDFDKYKAQQIKKGSAILIDGKVC